MRVRPVAPINIRMKEITNVTKNVHADRNYNTIIKTIENCRYLKVIRYNSDSGLPDKDRIEIVVIHEDLKAVTVYFKQEKVYRSMNFSTFLVQRDKSRIFLLTPEEYEVEMVIDLF